MNHIVEIWEMNRDERTVSVPSCLVCGWTGSGGSRPKAEAEGDAHEEGRDPAGPVGEISISGPTTDRRSARAEHDSTRRSI
ncbi:MAG: hypothetical protein BGO11_02780 [Solirubrobacterales bacterium 70-9]|nr:MAG: hypothetical protein BGO11_02780 [Solirubrobacterales bacterium 70-9]